MNNSHTGNQELSSDWGFIIEQKIIISNVNGIMKNNNPSLSFFLLLSFSLSRSVSHAISFSFSLCICVGMHLRIHFYACRSMLLFLLYKVAVGRELEEYYSRRCNIPVNGIYIILHISLNMEDHYSTAGPA